MPRKKLSRRDFLKVTGITLGTSVVACSGLAALATHSPAITLPESTYGDQNMSKKILIAYASKCGSTGEVASAMGKTLAQTGVRADVLPISKVSDLTGYQAVFVGSAIRMGKWLPEAAGFVSENSAAGFIEPVRTALTPAAEGYFAGKVDPNSLSFIENIALQAKNVPQGDFRDWDKITSWARSTYAQIGA
jgi:menaquinone-dependent protoporphyrinogen oxidase